jgi:hypothetical protein
MREAMTTFANRRLSSNVESESYSEISALVPKADLDAGCSVFAGAASSLVPMIAFPRAAQFTNAGQL